MSLMTAVSIKADDGAVDDKQQTPEAPAKPKRRTFTAEYKARILDEYEALTDVSDRGALLRRESLYSSHIAEWRRVRDAAVMTGLEPKKRSTKKTSEQRELEALRKRNEQLERKVAAQQTALELAGKAHALLEMLSESAASNNEQSKK